MALVKLKTTIHYEQLQNSTKRISVFQGGTRSGKSYNILVWFIVKLLNETGKVLTISRDSMPSLKGSVMRDFFIILESLELYDEKNHNKTESVYNLNKNIIEFVSLDQSIKIRGRKRNYLFLNEANETKYETFLQLAFRTTDKIVLDYNPHEEYSWIYDQVLTRNDAELFISTYKDNPFLPIANVEEIERLKDVDENYWRIYGLGERGISSQKIYSNWEIVESYPTHFDSISYGLDFGYNNPTCLVEIGKKDLKVYLRELIYKPKLLNSELIREMESLGINGSDNIYADSAEPDKIEEISQAGFNIVPANKSVHDGIDRVKRVRLYVHQDSVNGIKELRNYSWKVDKNGRVLEEPVKYMDHFCDGVRYGIFSEEKEYEVIFVG